MKERFTGGSRVGRRGHIARATRREVFRRDQFACQYCGERFSPGELTIDHLVPLDRGGLDEITNYVTCCGSCNQKKANLPLQEFADSLNLTLDDLPVHGDAVIDNDGLPEQLRRDLQPVSPRRTRWDAKEEETRERVPQVVLEDRGGKGLGEPVPDSAWPCSGDGSRDQDHSQERSRVLVAC